MIDSFLKEINNRDLESDDNLSLMEMKEESNVLSLTFKLQNDFDERGKFQVWKIECKDFIQRSICDDFFCSFEIFNEHALLWEYNRPKANLYFRGTTENISGLIGELYLKNFSITEGWMPLSEYLNDMVGVEELIKGGYGLLANAPIEIIKEFSEVLDKFNIKPSIIQNENVRYWNGVSWVNGPSSYSVLIFGRCFVIAKKFNEERIQ